MNIWMRLLPAAALVLPAMAYAQAAPAGFEDLGRIEQRVRQFAGDGRQPRVDRRLRLSACQAQPEILWYGTGETTVLVRCGGPRSWQVYVPVTLAAGQQAAPARGGQVVVVTRPVPRGTPLTAMDVKVEPQTAVIGGATAVDQVVGKVAVRALNPGEAVRASLIAIPPAVKRGDPVQIKTGGPGMEVTADGVAEEDGAEGGRIRVRNAASGGRMQAIVAAPGIVVLPGYKISEDGR